MPNVDRAFAPHCDELVLHAPERNCWACNLYPDWQAQRLRDGVNFTGESDPQKTPCPATLRRPVETIERWHGNVPETEAESQAYYGAIRQYLDARYPE